MIALAEHADGCVLAVRAQPGARRNAVVGAQAGALKVAVTAPPDQGRANKALAETLAAALGLKKSQVELIAGLYVGPIDNTMAGQPVSLAASSPDTDKYPRFSEIRDQAMVAELNAGDALYLPKLWWHQVEALSPFNGLVNYWWDAFSAGPDAPYTSMLLAMIAISERPLPERRAWKAWFDHYVFREHGHPLAHLPPAQHGLLGPLKDNYGKIRARIMYLLRGG